MWLRTYQQSKKSLLVLLTNIPSRSKPRKQLVSTKRWFPNAVPMARRQATPLQVVQLLPPTTTTTTTTAWVLLTSRNTHGGRQTATPMGASSKDGETQIPVT